MPHPSGLEGFKTSRSNAPPGIFLLNLLWGDEFGHFSTVCVLEHDMSSDFLHVV